MDAIVSCPHPIQKHAFKLRVLYVAMKYLCPVRFRIIFRTKVLKTFKKAQAYYLPMYHNPY